MGTLNEEAIFLEALQRATAGARAAYLDEACAGNDACRKSIEQLLAAHAHVGGFLREQPVAADATTAQPLTEQVGTRVGRYKLLEQIGEGGMGVVFMAQQSEPVKRRVAVKIVKPGMDSRQVVARFEAERQALAMMDHPNIAKVLDAGSTETGRPYFVMELVRGLPITDYCDRERLDTRLRLQLFTDVCKAVQHAHTKAIIHRDLKPSNVLVTLHDGAPVVKVIDFGVAKALNQELTERTLFTQFAQLVGTPLYMSPEQAELSGLDIDTRTDVYSLGVMLYELLTSTTPFNKEQLSKVSFDEMRRMIREDEPPRPSHRVSTLNAQSLSSVSRQRGIDERRMSQQLRGELDWIVMKTLEKDRNRRYESASALARDIERYLNDEPVQACPPSAAYRFNKFARRNKAKLATATMVFVVMSFGALISTWQAVRATTAQLRADANAAQAMEERRKAIGEERKALAAAESERISRLSETKERERAVKSEKAAKEQLYFADVRAGLGDWTLGNVARLSGKLLRHVPQNGDDDIRGWEWYYLLSLCHQEERTLRHHTGLVANVSWSPDGRYLASASYDGSVTLLDAASWDIKGTWLGETRMFAKGLCWSPDSRQLAWGKVASDNGVYVLEVESRSVKRLVGHTSSVWTVAWSPDGNYLASAGMDSTIRIWNPQTSETVRVIEGARGFISSVVWHPSVQRLASIGPNDGIRIWSTNDGESLCTNTDLQALNDSFVAWAPTGDELAVGTAQGELRVYKAADLTLVTKWSGHSGPVKCVAWDPDGRRLASGGADHLIHVWDRSTEKNMLTLRGHLNQLTSVAWHPDGRRLASAGSDDLVKVWKLPPDTQPRQLKGNSNRVDDIVWRPDNRTLRSLGPSLVSDWNTQSGDCLQTLSIPKRPIGQFTSDGNFFAVAAKVDTQLEVSIHNAETRELIQTQSSELADATLLAISPGARKLAIALTWGPRKLQVLDLREKKVSFESQPISGPRALSWSPDGRFLAVAGKGEPSDGGNLEHAAWIHIFDVEQRKRILKERHGDSRVTATAVAWSPDSRKVVTGDDNGLVEIRELATGNKVAIAKLHTTTVTSIDWSPDNRRIASSARDGTISIWDVESVEELVHFGVAMPGVTRLQWSPNGRSLAAALSDGTIQIWDAAAGYEFEQSDDYAAIHLGHELDAAQRQWELGQKVEARERVAQALHHRRKTSRDYPKWCASAAHELIRKMIVESEEAFRLIPLAGELTPSDPKSVNRAYAQAHNSIGVSHLRKQSHKEAEKSLLAARQFDDSLEFVHSNLSRLFYNTGRFAEAEASVRRAIEINRSNPYDQAHLAHVLAAQSRLDDASAAFAACVQMDREAALPRYWLALTHLAMNRQSLYRSGCVELLEIFQKTNSALDARWTTWTILLGPNALDDYTSVIDLAERFVNDPELGREFAQTLGGLLFRAGRLKEALPRLDAAANSDRANTSSRAYTFYLLAMTHRQLGRHNEARILLNRADTAAQEELKPENNSLWNRLITLDLFRKEAHAMIDGSGVQSYQPRSGVPKSAQGGTGLVDGAALSDVPPNASPTPTGP